MDDYAIDAYNVSQASYGSDTHHKKLEDKGYKKDTELSSGRHSVYSNGKRTVVGYRGTDIKDKEDLKADVDLSFKREKGNKSFKEAEDVYTRARDKYKDSEIFTSGHSLGGSKSIHIAKKFGVKKSYAFNPGTALLGTEGNDTVVYNTKGDPVSSRIRSKYVNFVKAKSLNPHSLSNYEDHFNAKPVDKPRKRVRFSPWQRMDVK